MGKLYSALIGLSLIWGTSFLFMKILVTSMSPFVVVFGRCFFGFMILVAIAVLGRRGIQLKNRPWGKLFLVALTNNVLPWILICSSETKISSGLASVINATTPIWTLLIGFFLFSSRLKKNQWIGISIGFIGIYILSEIKPGDVLTGNTLGIFLMLCATFFYGLGTHLSKKYLSSLSVLETSIFTLGFSVIISFLTMISTSSLSYTEIVTVKNLFAFIGLGAFGSGIAYLLFYFLIQKGGPEFASLVTYLVPVSAVVWGAVLLGEPVHISMIIGLMVIFAGVFISSLKENKKKKEKMAA